jgi:hypothetical protein
VTFVGFDILGVDGGDAPAGGYDMNAITQQLNAVYAHHDGDKLVPNPISVDTGEQLIALGQKAIKAALNAAFKRVTSTALPTPQLTTSIDNAKNALDAATMNVNIFKTLGPVLPQTIADEIRVALNKALVEANAQLTGEEWVSTKLSLFTELFESLKNLAHNAPTLIPSWVYYLAGGIAVTVAVGALGVYVMPVLLMRRAR